MYEEKDAVLGDESQLASEDVEPDIADIVTVDCDLPNSAARPSYGPWDYERLHPLWKVLTGREPAGWSFFLCTVLEDDRFWVKHYAPAPVLPTMPTYISK
jgi:hypothetical protein